MKFAIERKVVLRQLAWEMFVVGVYAATSDERMAILRTMVGLVESEACRSSTRTYDGNSARALLPRLIGATREVRTPYIDEGFRLGEELLGNLESKAPPSEVLCEAVLGVLLSVRVEDSWADGTHFHFGVGVVRPESARGQWIVATCERLWAIAADSTRSLEPRRIALSLLSKHHQALNYEDLHSNPDDENPPDWSPLLRVHLEHARSLATQGGLDAVLWFELRSIWDWHAEFDEDPELKRLAEESEKLFRDDPVRGAFAALLLDDDLSGAAINEVASQLRSESASAIAAFFTSGCEFLAGDEHAWRRRKLDAVAWGMPDGHDLPDGMRGYIASVIGDANGTERAFAIEMLGGFLQRCRAHGDEVLAQEVRWALGAATDDQCRREVVLGVYVNTRVLAIRAIRPVECDVIIGVLPLFDTEAQLRFLGCIFAIGSAKVRAMAELIFDRVSVATPFKLDDAIARFCVGFHAFTIGIKTPLFSQSDYEWLLDQLARLPEPVPFARLGEMDDVVEPYPKFGIPWFAALVSKRIDRLRPLLNRKREVYKHDEAVWVLTDDFPFLALVAPLADGPVRPEDRAAVEQLLSLTSAEQSVSYHLPHVMARLDPTGVLVPALVCERIRALKTPSWQELATWGNFASAYPFNSAAWRCIAIEVCTRSLDFNEDDTARSFSHLALHREGVWSGRPGTVADRFFKNLERAKELLADEADPALRPFRAWRVKCAEADLRHQQGRLAEERRGSTDGGDSE